MNPHAKLENPSKTEAFAPGISLHMADFGQFAPPKGKLLDPTGNQECTAYERYPHGTSIFSLLEPLSARDEQAAFELQVHVCGRSRSCGGSGRD